jgi:CubicO group peptidase (beta-lactamase class C family)
MGAKRIVLALLGATAVAVSATMGPDLIGEARYVLANASLGTAVVAQDLCYGILVQGRTEAEVRGAELGPYVDPKLSWIRARVDTTTREVRATLVGLFASRAVQRDDGSCRLGDGPADRSWIPAPGRDSAPWPEGNAVDPEAGSLVPDMAALRSAVAAEFEPTASGVNRGTRSVLVIHRGRLVHEQHAPGWDGAIPQNGRSMSKVMAALLAGLVAERNGLHRHDLGLFSEWSDDRSAIRLDHLLRMLSGLSWNESNGPGDSGRATLLASSAAEYAMEKPLERRPGEAFSYSAGDVELAVEAVRRRSGLDDEAWARFPYEALFERLGMRSAVMDRDRSGRFVVSTSMHASAYDWARLGLFLARGGVWKGERILPEGWVDFLRTPTPQSKCNYGATVWIRGGCTQGNPSPVFELSGFMGQGVTIVPRSETVVVRTGFGPWIMGDLLERVFSALDVDAPTRMAMEERS